MSAAPSPSPAPRLRRLAVVLVALACAAPLVTGWGVTLFPQTVARIAFLRLLALVCLPVLVALLARPGPADGARSVLRSPVALALALWCTVLVLTAAFSVDGELSLWDAQGRQFGVVTGLCCAVIAATALVGLRRRRDWRPVAGVFLAVGGVVGLHALAERADWVRDFDAFPERVSALFGNPTFLAGYALFVVFLGVVAAARTRSAVVRAVCGVVVLWAALAVVLTENRASLLALLLGGLIAGVAYAVSREAGPRLRRGVGTAALLTAVLAGGLWIARDRPFVRSIPAVRRLAGVSLESPSVQRRLLLWNTAIEAGLERPVVGWGPRTYSRAFDRRFPTRLYVFDPGHPWADRAHSEPANAFAEQGLLGLLAYLALLGAPVVVLWRRYERKETDVHAVAAGFGLTAAVFVHGLFAFDVAETFLLLVLFGAFVAADRNPASIATETEERAPSDAPETALPAARKVLTGAAVVASALLVVPLVARPVQAATLAATAHTALTHHAPPDWPADVAERLGAALDAPAPGSAEGRNVLAGAVLARASEAEFLGRGADARRMLDRASAAFARTLATTPADLRSLVAWASVLEVRVTLYGVTPDVDAALAALRRAQERCPTRPDLPIAAAQLAMAAKRPEEALAWADRAVDVEPFAPESIWRAALLFDRAGQPHRARSLLDQAASAGIRFTGEGRRVVESLLGRPEPPSDR